MGKRGSTDNGNGQRGVKGNRGADAGASIAADAAPWLRFSDDEFGVDDGEGYVDRERRWRFTGAYLIFGQWKQRVLGGFNRVPASDLTTGD